MVPFLLPFFICCTSDWGPIVQGLEFTLLDYGHNKTVCSLNSEFVQ